METKIAVAILLAALCLFTPTPVIDGIGPDYGINDGIVDVVIEGKRFDDQASVKLAKSGEADLVATNIKVISKKQISCSFDLRGQTGGKWNVTVENPTKVGKKVKTGVLVDGFTIQYPTPNITAVDPKTGLNSEIVTLNITGTGFRTGARGELIAPSGKIEASDVKVVSNTRITAKFDLTYTLPEIYDLKVTNDDGKTGILLAGFKILERQIVKPGISRIVPNEGFNNVVLKTDIYGENFDPGASVMLVGTDGEEISVGDINVQNSREISCSLDLSQEQVGGYDVVVLNTDGQEAILINGFSVKEPSDMESNDLLKSVFFDFDKAEIRPDQYLTLEDNLKYLIEHSDLYILLGGHADERGSREYNLGLSERRAGAVKDYLVEKGIDPSKIMIFAYGEDYPVRIGHDEGAWSFNRRVDLKVGYEPATYEDGIIVGNGKIDQVGQ